MPILFTDLFKINPTKSMVNQFTSTQTSNTNPTDSNMPNSNPVTRNPSSELVKNSSWKCLFMPRCLQDVCEQSNKFRADNLSQSLEGTLTKFRNGFSETYGQASEYLHKYFTF